MTGYMKLYWIVYGILILLPQLDLFYHLWTPRKDGEYRNGLVIKLVLFQGILIVLAVGIAGFITTTILKWPYEKLLSPGVYQLAVLGMVTMLLLISCMTIVICCKVQQYRLFQRKLLVFLACPVFQGVFLFLYYGLCRELNAQVILFGVIILTASAILNRAILKSIEEMLHKVTMEEEMTELYSQRQVEMDYYDMVSGHMQEMRMLRHEFANQLQTAYQLAEGTEGNRQAREVLDGMTQWLQKAALKTHCENPIVNTILSVLEKQLEEDGTRVKIEAYAPENVGIKEEDLYGALHQLFISGKEKAKQAKAEEVQIKIGVQGGFLLAEMELPSGEDREKPKSKWKFSEVLKKYVNRYHGKLYEEQNDGVYRMGMLLEEN